MIALTMAQVDERRVEVASLTDQIRALGRRRRHLEREILAGYALPSSGDARQLSLPIEDKAALDEAAAEAVAEVMAKQNKAPQSRAKNEKAPAKEPVVLGDMTMAQVRQVLLDEIGTWTSWYSGAAADHALWAELRRTGRDMDEDGSGVNSAARVDDVGHEALTALATEGKIQCSEKPGNWGNLYAPLGVSRTAERGPNEPKPPRKPAVKKGKAQPKKAARKAAKKAPLKKVAETPARALGDVIEETLRDWKTWFIEEQLQTKVLEAMPLGARLSERGWKETLSEMLKQGRLERTEENGHTLYRVPPVDAGDRARDRVRWDFILDTVEKKITKRPLQIVPEGDAEEAICRLLTDAGALLDDGNLETSCEIPEKHAGKACMQVTREYLYDLLDEKPGQTAAELASAVEVPEGLVAALLAQLARAKKLRVTGKPHALRWHAIPAKEKRPKSHAQDRTLPILPDVEPAPAREEADS